MLTRTSLSTRRAFTLVELLVVIGIIALLISILLPALSKARRQANVVKCSSNMHQIALAVLNYTSDNKGHLMPCLIYSTGGSIYPDGFFWAAELVHQKYLVAPDLGYANNIAFPPPATDSVFQCPEGIRSEDNMTNGQLNSAVGLYPTDAKNNGWWYGILDNPRVDHQIPYGTATWYQLNSRITGFASNYSNAGGTTPFNAPFVYFAAAPNNGETELGDIDSINYSRTTSMVKKSSLMVMIAEAGDSNWVNQTRVITNGRSHWAARLSARHGKKTVDGTNAYTNFAFFDGHVALFPTEPIDQNSGGAGSVLGLTGVAGMPQSSGTVFSLYINQLP